MQLVVLAGRPSVAVIQQPPPMSPANNISLRLGVGSGLDPILLAKFSIARPDSLAPCIPSQVDTNASASVSFNCTGVPDGNYRCVPGA